jgi:glycosyltransferase involved in cell wall biosynthesis
MSGKSIKVLATGEGWPSQEAGGLNTYYQSICETLGLRHHVEALVCCHQPPEKAAGKLKLFSIVSPKETMNARQQAFRQYAKDRMKSNEVDLVYTHFAPYGLGPALEAKKRNIPVVMSFHGPWAEEMKLEGGGAKLKLKALLAKRIEMKMYRTADRFIVLSGHFRDLLHEKYEVPLEKIHVVPGAVDTERFQPAPSKRSERSQLLLPENQLVVLTGRRLVHRMGIIQLIEAWNEVIKAVPNALLLIGGKGPLEEELKRRIQSHGLENHIQLLGYVKDEQLPLYYQAADLFVVPTQALEGFGLITVEAMASGLPVAATPVGGNKEILEGFHPPFLFKGTSSHDMAEGLIPILKHPESWPSGVSCRAYVCSRFTWGNTAREVDQVFELAMQDKGVIV